MCTTLPRTQSLTRPASQRQPHTQKEQQQREGEGGVCGRDAAAVAVARHRLRCTRRVGGGRRLSSRPRCRLSGLSSAAATRFRLTLGRGHCGLLLLFWLACLGCCHGAPRLRLRRGAAVAVDIPGVINSLPTGSVLCRF
ncbi:uncharacterized protein Tco025E_09149 [Trypanosoma conorhini]|uniref:Uncharacterized protein n=1 Tax=Trypanosoma conorhini TaxID=83891 RepID=A0A3R7RAI5_9TRYP|nr:uncharacterized protein Tco025E_09149 [Trypanosoma conorhini]RNE98843.1 hypothetical protein Tco025E_09149 [Trypanosoma conorhini]